jgi:hypothetical protein
MSDNSIMKLVQQLFYRSHLCLAFIGCLGVGCGTRRHLGNRRDGQKRKSKEGKILGFQHDLSLVWAR